jgi:hypothetical protein
MTYDDSHDQVGGGDRHCTEEEEGAVDAGGSMARNLSRYNCAEMAGDHDDEDDRRRNRQILFRSAFGKSQWSRTVLPSTIVVSSVPSFGYWSPCRTLCSSQTRHVLLHFFIQSNFIKLDMMQGALKKNCEWRFSFLGGAGREGRGGKTAGVSIEL